MKMIRYIPQVNYDGSEEYARGFRSLNEILVGVASPERGSYVLSSGAILHNPEITFQHEATHNHLFIWTTIGNIQQLISKALYIKGLNKKLLATLIEIKTISLDSEGKHVRWLHEGCATYVALKYAQVYKLNGWEYTRSTQPKYYLDALRPFEEIVEGLPIFEDSKIILAETITRFALSPSIYNFFYNLEDLDSFDPSIFTQCLDRMNKILNFLADAKKARKFADSYNTFIKETYPKVHRIPWTTDVLLRSKKVDPSNVEKFAIKELHWLYQYISKRLPHIEIVNPKDVPQIQKVANQWIRYFNKQNIKTHNLLSFSIVKSERDIDSQITIIPPSFPAKVKRLPHPDLLCRILKEEDIVIFAQIYIHRKIEPFILNPTIGRRILQNESYIRFSPATIDRDSLTIDWYSSYYTILPVSELYNYLQLIDSHNLLLCFSEKEIYDLIIKQHEKIHFSNLITGLICPTDFRSLKECISRWLQHIEGCTVMRITQTNDYFVIFFCNTIGVQLVAPVSYISAARIQEWAHKSRHKGLRIWNPSQIHILPDPLEEIVLQGIAFFGFSG